jgi:diphosphomevalonate decarboxylase
MGQSAKGFNMNWIEASSPSNIALIKYMGKTDADVNRPTNASISWTLEKLRTYVRIQKNINLEMDMWNPFVRSDLQEIKLSETGRSKFLNFFGLLKIEFKLSGFYEIESANNFPSDCGLASSASSFSALTKCAHEIYLSESQGKARPYTAKELSKLSQKGSGSSCRSFFSPWGLWHGGASDTATNTGAEDIQLPIKNLMHMVVMCDESVKSVSSSQAHKLVLSSDHFTGRPERATVRLQNLISAARSSDWSKIRNICWNEFWDMHNLFHTSDPAFMYMNGATVDILTDLNHMWQKDNDGPIITMDAGSNIHLLFREDQKELYSSLQNKFIKKYNIWSDHLHIGEKITSGIIQKNG